MREILLVIRATEDRDRESWRRSALVASFIYNFGADRGKKFKMKTAQQLFPNLWSTPLKRIADFEVRWEAALEQEARYLRLLEQSQKRREANG